MTLVANTVAPLFALQEALKVLLPLDSNVKALLGVGPQCRIYDEPPEEPTYPFAIFTDHDEDNVGAEALRGSSIAFQIAVYSRQPGYKECATIAQAIIVALDEKHVSVDGFETGQMSWQSTGHRRFTDPSVLRMSLIRFQIELRPIL